MEIKSNWFWAGRLQKTLQTGSAWNVVSETGLVLENYRTDFDFFWWKLIWDSPQINYSLGSLETNRLELIRRWSDFLEISKVPKDPKKCFPARKLIFKVPEDPLKRYPACETKTSSSDSPVRSSSESVFGYSANSCWFSFAKVASGFNYHRLSDHCGPLEEKIRF